MLSFLLVFSSSPLYAFEAKLITANSSGTQTVTEQWYMRSMSMSGDGKLAVFEYAVSGAETPVYLSEDGSAQEGVMLKDFETGKISHVLSYHQKVETYDRGSYYYPVISGNGRYIVFLTHGDLTKDPVEYGTDKHVYRYDREDKSFKKVSVLPESPAIGETWRDVSVSYDGRFVLFNITWGTGKGLYLRDMNKTQADRVDLRYNGNVPDTSSSGWAGRQSVSDDGRYVAYKHSDKSIVDAASLGYNLESAYDVVYLRDMETETNYLVSKREGGVLLNWDFGPPVVSSDGTKVLFSVGRMSVTEPYMEGIEANNSVFIYVVDEERLECLAENNDGWEYYYIISRDGNVVAFVSDADELVEGDTNKAPDVFIKNLINDQVIRITVDEEGKEVKAPSWTEGNPMTSKGLSHFVDLSLSDDGRYVAFKHFWEFTDADTNQAFDAYRVDTKGYFYEPGGDPYALVEESPTKTRIGLPDYQINTANLDLSLKGTLMRVPNRGPLMHLTLTRASKLEYQRSLFGNNWISNYEASVERLAGGYLAIWQGSGKRLVFSPPEGYNPDAPVYPVEYRAPAGNFDKVTWHNEGEEEYITWWRRGSRNTWRFDHAAEESVSYLTSITDRNGNKLTINVDLAIGRISSVTEPANRTLTFQYNDATGLCTRVSLTGGRYVTFAYNSDNLIQRITDMAGYSGTYEYDENGNITRMTRDSHYAEFSYGERSEGGDLGWYVTGMKDSETGVSSYEFTGHNPMTVKRTSRGGKVTRYQSANGQTTGIIDPLEGVTSTTYENRLPVSFTDRMGNQRKALYDDHGNPTRITDARGHVTVLEYDDEGLLTRRLNAEGERWLYEYDTKGNLTKATSPDDNVTCLFYDSDGQVSKVTDQRGKETLYNFDDNGNLMSVTDPMGKVTAYLYNSYRIWKITDPLERVKVVTYDDNDRIKSIQYGEADNAPKVTFSYDAFGETGLTDELGRTWSFQRNRHGQVLRTETSLGQVQRYEYDVDGNLTYEIDPLGERKRYTYDDNGNRINVFDELNRYDHNVYNKNDLVSSHLDKNGNMTKLSYNANDWLTHVIDPLGMHAVTVYDDVGRVARTGYMSQAEFDSLPRAENGMLLDPQAFYDALYRRLDRTYDGEGKLKTKAHYGSEITDTTYTYDDAGNVTGISGPAGEVTFGYDDAGRLTSAEFPFNKQMTITYDDAGQVQSLTYPDGETVNYTWQNRNLMPVSREYNPIESFYEENTSPLASRIEWIEGAGIDFSYDRAQQLTGINRADLIQTTLEYDRAGRITGVSHTIPESESMTLSYTYDSADRTTIVETDGLVERFIDTAGFEGEFSAGNRLSRYQGDTATYDMAGNLTTIGSNFSASYDHENRLASMTENNVETGFDYTGDVLVKVASGGRTRYQAFIEGNLLFETDDAGVLIASYFYSGDRLVAMRLHGEDSDAGLYYYLFDRNGNTLALVDHNGSVKTRYGYLPYGQITVSGADIHNPFRYAGEWGIIEENSHVLRMGRRHYDSIAGRFLQKDPAGFIDGFNLYQYAGGNPVDQIDPSGEIAITTIIVGTAVAVGITKFLVNKLNDLIEHGQELQNKRIENLRRGALGDSRAEDKAREAKKEIVEHYSNVSREVAKTFPGTTVKPTAPGFLGSVKSIFNNLFGGSDEKEEKEK